MTPEEFLIKSGAYDGAKYIENDEDLKEWTSDFVATCGLMERYAAVKMSESAWVSVEEELPKQYGKYWVYRKSCDKMHPRVWNNTGWAYDNDQITHWMPLPEKPKQL